jgi:hypothetical protein
MGTNFYVRTPSCKEACEHCRESDLTHLGKSSAGWKFSFRHHGGFGREGASALSNWLDLARSGPIEDEYGQPVELAELLTLVMDKQSKLCRLDPETKGKHGIPVDNDGEFHYAGFDFSSREFF